jgi:dihydrofolate reductase
VVRGVQPLTTEKQEMGKIVVTDWCALDGVVEDPGGGEGFERGGWVFEVDQGDEGTKFKLDEALASDALLLGRHTYENFAEAWPKRTGQWADKLNAVPKYVVSSTLEDPTWHNTTVIRGDLGEQVTRIKRAHDGDITVHGSTQLVQALLDRDLVDELRLMVFPVILGAGQRLFGRTSGKKALRLVDSRTVGDGVTILVYEPTAGTIDSDDRESKREAAFRRGGIISQ